MANDVVVEKARAVFQNIPWAAAILNQKNIKYFVPDSMQATSSGRDSLFSETFRTDRTLPVALAFYTDPEPDQSYVEEVSTLMVLGDGINGHPGVMHGGVVAAILDEAMGILEIFNHNRRHAMDVKRGLAHGDRPPQDPGFYTADLRIKYVKPVLVPGALLVTAQYVRRERKKEWIRAEIRQHLKGDDGKEGTEVLCAIGEGFFVRPKWIKM